MAFPNTLGLISFWLLASTVYAAPAIITPRSTADNATTAASAVGNLPLQPVRNHHGNQGAGGNFRPRKSVQLAWQTPNNESAVTVGVTMRKTAVALEDIDQVIAVDCTGDDSVAVSFNSTDAYTEALSEWGALNSTFVLITNHMGDCDSELERSFFVTDSASIVPFQNNLTIVALAEKSDLMSTASSTEFDFSSGTNALAAKRSISWNNDGLSVDYNYSISSEQTIIDTSYVTVVVNEATIANSVSYSGHAKWELFKGVTEFYIDVDKSIYHYADIDVTVKAPWTDTWSWAPDALSYSILDVPGIISLGPSAGVTFGGKFTAAAAGSVTGQFTSEMPNGTIHMDFKDWDSSYSEGWEAQHEAVFNITEDVSLTLTPYIDFTVEFACKLFDGLIDLSTGVKAEPSFPFVTTATATQSFNTTSGNVTYPSSTSTSACANGIEEAIDFQFDITAFATEWASITLYEYEADIWDGCQEYASLKA